MSLFRFLVPLPAFPSLLLMMAGGVAFGLAAAGDAVKERPRALTIELDKPPKVSKEAEKLRARKPKPTGPVILDARGAFAYNMGHVTGAQPVRWEDFSQTEEPHKGNLDPDLNFVVRKLRVLGVSPDREVIVIGQGPKGWGEEGRIAWMLKYLGVKKVTVRNYENVPTKKSFSDAGPVEEASYWSPKLNEGLRVRKADVENLVAAKAPGTAIVDVRSPEEYAGKKTHGEARAGHIPGAVNIPWTEFTDKEGNPLMGPAVAEVLKKHKLDPAQNLIFYCTGGVRSGYATFVASTAGLQARNFDGSFWEWSADERLPVEK